MITELAGLLLKHPVFDLGSSTPALEGIYSPGYSDSEIGQHVHDTFLKDAETYLSFCPVDRASIEHWKGLIQNALGAFRPETVVDVGSGGGISVLPTLELFKQARVIATDLALPLLSELRNLARRDNLERLTVLQMNAEDMLFLDGEVDLVMGGNVLHHALSLEKMFSEIRRVLRPGGPRCFLGGFRAWRTDPGEHLRPVAISQPLSSGAVGAKLGLLSRVVPARPPSPCGTKQAARTAENDG